MRKGEFIISSQGWSQSGRAGDRFDDVPVWEQPMLWRKAAEWSSIRYRNPVSLLEADNPAFEPWTLDPSGVCNHHFIRIGSQSVLAQAGDVIHLQVAQIMGFDRGSAWEYQKPWLSSLFREYFLNADDQPSWTSFVSARRPAHLRKNETNDDVVIAPSDLPKVRMRIRAAKLSQRPYLRLLDEQIPTSDLYFDRESASVGKHGYVAKIRMPRVVASKHLAGPEYYSEHWLCLASKGDDEPRLKQGVIPAIASSPFSSMESRLRNTAILNLAKLSTERQSGRILQKNLGLEISPEGGAIASLRMSIVGLDMSMMFCSPIEHFAVQQALKDLV